MYSHPSLRASCVLAAVALMAVAGCGEDSTKSQRLSVTAKDVGPNKYAFEGVKELHPGTVEIKFTNAGKVPHEFQLIRADGNHSADEVKAALTKVITSEGPVPLPDWFHPYGGIGTTAPGGTGTAKVVLKKSGTYYAVDAETGEGNAPPRFTQGAFASFEAKGDKVGGSLPSEDTKVTVKDVGPRTFSFENSSLKSGTVNLEFDNRSKDIHHVVALPILPGKTFAEVQKVLTSQGPPSGPPPIDEKNATGTPVLDANQKTVVQLNFKEPGNYVLACFISDKDGKGKPHTQEGLLKEVKVSEPAA